MESERMDEFERELREALARRPAPPSLKRHLMERRAAEALRQAQAERPFITWQRLAASLLLAAVVAGSAEWRIVEQHRREEAARQQVLTALRITGQALDRMNARLAARRNSPQD
jgi:uncharacterized membrane protein YidH (DUF202 family)